ncbi:MAG: hypothetical protein AABY93_01090 [Bacteroidota bacterium]
MVKAKVFKSSGNKRESINGSRLLKSAEDELEKKKQELLRAKKRHRRLAGEFIDLWVKVRRLKRNTSSKLELK